MLGENHLLVLEFPEDAELIEHLKQNDEAFAQKAKRYHQLDHTIRGLEVSNVPTTDENFMQLKSERVVLKDEIYQYLQQIKTG
ncbi:YdcH family protein [Shewanella marina]|uniref:YdcH family protein n=1 Tax=Shewanella marina TaxID=487319 RepID=UPI00046FABBD|nr:DUF465 domain-containing protein [Shewanella marina]